MKPHPDCAALRAFIDTLPAGPRKDALKAFYKYWCQKPGGQGPGNRARVRVPEPVKHPPMDKAPYDPPLVDETPEVIGGPIFIIADPELWPELWPEACAAIGKLIGRGGSPDVPPIRWTLPAGESPRVPAPVP
ncbi:MAG: hypothetical protein KGJ62_14930 [Armatimonadetes bacterium]|nr:hypothetical protein [Armatimonadota bacterium]MDE2206168.1 hypothetical protein [Armatimonadota bacterium]